MLAKSFEILYNQMAETNAAIFGTFARSLFDLCDSILVDRRRNCTVILEMFNSIKFDATGTLNNFDHSLQVVVGTVSAIVDLLHFIERISHIF